MLRQRIDGSKENFENSDKQLREYFEIIKSNKCGTNTNSCSGLMDSYYNLLAVKKTFDETYNKQELIFKKILTKVIEHYIKYF